MDDAHRTSAWPALGRMLDDIQPKGLGILLPPILQLHRPAYLEARARTIVVAVALPSQISALTGLVEEASIEAVIATQGAANEFAADLERVGLTTNIKAWFIVDEKPL